MLSAASRKQTMIRDQQQIDDGEASPRDETRQIPPPAKTGIGLQR
jgi:hypothetical protein